VRRGEEGRGGVNECGYTRVQYSTLYSPRAESPEFQRAQPAAQQLSSSAAQRLSQNYGRLSYTMSDAQPAVAVAPTKSLTA
jgi:hypothetical protein